jgi:uncharacterized protein YukE
VANGQDPTPGYQGGADFYIDFGEVPKLQKMLVQATDYCDDTAAFIQRHKKFEGGEGWFNELHDGHPAVVEQATSWFRKAADPLMATTADKIDGTVKSFMKTEHANAAALDAAVPWRVDTVDVSLPEWDKSQTPIESTPVGEITPYGPFEYVEDPAEALREPHDYTDDPQLTFQPQIWDLDNPASAARSAVVKVTDFLAGLGLMPGGHSVDPYDVFVKPVVGDWAAMRQFADVLRQAGDAAERTGIGIDRARHMLEPVWRGHSADACVVWLGAVAKPMRDAPNALDAMAAAYERAAQGAADYRAVLDSLLDSIINKCFFIGLALSIGAGGAAATGGVSAGAALLICGVEIYGVIDAVEDLISAAGVLDTIIADVKAAQNEYGIVQTGGQQMPNLPPVSGDESALSVLPS